MTSLTHAQVTVVRREEKLAKLSAFIEGEFAKHRTSSQGSISLAVIARSPASPVLLALRDAIAANADIEPTISTILGSSDDLAGADTVSLGRLRCATSGKVLEAHEQLLIGDSAAWVGDCMRRDPARTDSYERFVDDASEAVTWASLAFSRLWEICEDIAVDADCGAASKAFVQAAEKRAMHRALQNVRH